MTTRKELYRLIDGLSDERLDEAAAALRELSKEHMRWTLESAPIDDEPVTEEERVDLERAVAAIAAGDTIAADELDALFDE